MEAQIAQLDGGDTDSDAELVCAGVLHYAACHPGEVLSDALFRAIGGAGFGNRRLAGNAVEVACLLFQLEKGGPVPVELDVDLPEPQNGWSPDEFDAAVYHAKRRTPQAFATLVCELRRHEAERRYSISAAAPLAAAHAELHCSELAEIVAKLAPQCKFERTGDWYIRQTVRAMLPAVAVADLAADEAPFRLVSEHMGRSESNEAVGRLFRTRVETLLQEETDPLSPVTLFLAAAVIAEFCDFDKPPPVFSNIDVGDCAAGIVLYHGFDGGAGHECAVTIANGGAAVLHGSVVQALLTWIVEDPRTQVRGACVGVAAVPNADVSVWQDMRAAVYDVEALNPDCAIAKILSTTTLESVVDDD